MPGHRDREVLPSFEELKVMTDVNELYRLRQHCRVTFRKLQEQANGGKPSERLRHALNLYQSALSIIGDRLRTLTGVEKLTDARIENLIIAVALLIDDDSDENWQRLEEAFAPLHKPIIPKVGEQHGA